MNGFNEAEWLAKLNSPKHRSAAFGRIVQEYQQPIYWHIRKMVLNHDDANDVMQTTFMKAWSALDSFRGESKISTWLFRIAVNETITFLNSQRNKNSYSTDDIESSMAQNLEADPYFSGDEAQLKFQKAIMKLPDKQRLVFNMKYFDDLKYEEMEEILGTSVGALKASYHHAVKKIEAYLLSEI
ncbi:RNA polymerase sigma factor [Paludibacter jiangxiensis]|uniref:RNA polymerase sigma-70 factor, ECF subfamily n=1 Tax=Paludibacter jiangxiensis TaxID=681398 RepID=A0A161L7I5_9BACT|nr:RNA polymerase sigma factor [Paludibacter jiangxiensis]MDP4202053.1 RNA polymerase sigma factor [Bacteroidota bacterium]GAT62704.1 RNA polymerase sigma-70 factor, ECF subfamily [Paludibacter jiangxiensis]